MTHRRLAELPAPEAAARLAGGAFLLLPMGSTETHGPQAPMGDYLLAEAIAVRIAAAATDAGAEALVAPVLPFGGADFFQHVPGAVALSTPTLAAVLEETLGLWARQGLRRILIVNGHGGSIPAIEMAQRATRDRNGLLVPALHLWRVAGAALPPLGTDPRAAGHGGDPVWSVTLHLRPDLCRPDRAAPRRPAAPVLGLPVAGFGALRFEDAEIAVPLAIEEIAPGGVAAEDPRAGSAEAGARIVDHLVGLGARLLVHLKERVA